MLNVKTCNHELCLTSELISTYMYSIFIIRRSYYQWYETFNGVLIKILSPQFDRNDIWLAHLSLVRISPSIMPVKYSANKNVKMPQNNISNMTGQSAGYQILLRQAV